MLAKGRCGGRSSPLHLPRLTFSHQRGRSHQRRSRSMVVVTYGRPTEDGFADLEPPPGVERSEGSRPGPFAGSLVRALDGRAFSLPLLTYLPAVRGGHLPRSGSRAANARRPDAFCAADGLGVCAAHPNGSAPPPADHGDFHPRERRGRAGNIGAGRPGAARSPPGGTRLEGGPPPPLG